MRPDKLKVTPFFPLPLRADDDAAVREYSRRLAGLYRNNASLSLSCIPPADEPIAPEIVAIGQEVNLSYAVERGEALF